MIKTEITNELARAVGLIATRHPECSVRIEWRETSDEREWFITADSGASETTYVVDDETGTNMPLNANDRTKYERGESVLQESEPA
jgi:hypothetical protein